MVRKPLESIPVIFRAAVEDGRLWVTAVFPTLLGTDDPATFTIYQPVGQHGSGTRGWYHRTRPATAAEYRSLLAELRQIYERGPGDRYKLRVRQRMAYQYHEIRYGAYLQMLGAKLERGAR